MRWTEVSVTVLPSQAECAGAVLLGHCPQGFAEVPGAQSRRILKAYLPAGAPGRRVLGRLRRDLARAFGPATLTARVVRDDLWMDAWKAHARTICIGRLVIVPSWIPRRADQDEVEVRLDPGMAFGSGEHPTTRLCLSAIERYTRAGAAVIDVGTGSGILAIAAARLGAARVVATDTDPVAVAVARDNARANGVASRVAVRETDGLGRLRLRAHLIVANLTAGALPALLPGVQRHLLPGGRFVACGFGAARARLVTRAMRAAGLRPVAVEGLGGWCAVHALASGRRARRASRTGRAATGPA